MNLNNNPTKQELSALFAQCDDEAGHHILWVSNSGNVKIDLLVNTIPAKWAKDHENLYKFRLETWVQGNGYTGQDASRNANWIDRIYESITEHWAKGTNGYIDSF